MDVELVDVDVDVDVNIVDMDFMLNYCCDVDYDSNVELLLQCGL